ncbi:MAG: hypothetical protein ACM3XN_09640 [Chloroflexota bacterium]
MDQQLNQIAQMARQLAQSERQNEQTLKQLQQQTREQSISQQLGNLANAESSAYTQLERIASLCDEALRSAQTSGGGMGTSMQSSTGTSTQSSVSQMMQNTQSSPRSH